MSRIPLHEIFPQWLVFSGLASILNKKEQIAREGMETDIPCIRDAVSTIRSEHLAALSMYYCRTPFIYFDREAARDFLNLLSLNKDISCAVVSSSSIQINHALQVMMRQAGESSEEPLSLKNPGDMLYIEKTLHPEYQTRAEHVLRAFVRVALQLAKTLDEDHVPTRKKKRRPRPRKKDKDGYDSMPLGNAGEALARHGLGSLVKGFSRDIRNAIAHGDVAFEESRVLYRKSGKEVESLSGSDLAKLADDLADTVHGMAFALMLFFASLVAEERSRVRLAPSGIKLIWVQEVTRFLGTSLVAGVETSHHTSESGRLVLFFESDATKREQYLIMTMRAAYAALYFGLDTYEDFWINVDVGKGVPATYAVELKKMAESFEAMQPGLLSPDTTFLWHDSSKVDWIRYKMKHAISVGIMAFKDAVAEEPALDLFHDNKDYEIRHIRNNGVKDIRRIEAEVYLRSPPSHIDGYGDIIHKIVRDLKSERVRALMFQESGVRRRPQRIWIHIHTRNARARGLLRQRNGHPEYLMVVEWPSPQRIYKFFAQWEVGPGTTRAQINRKSKVFKEIFAHLDGDEA